MAKKKIDVGLTKLNHMNIRCPACKSQVVYFVYSDNSGEHFCCYDCEGEWAQQLTDSNKNLSNSKSKCLTNEEKKVWRKHFKFMPESLRLKLFNKLTDKKGEGIVTNEGVYKMFDGVIIKMKNKTT